METVHVELAEANDFVLRLHRHHKPCTGHRFSIGCKHDGTLFGVAIVGRPVARMCDQYNTLEISRLCTDGTKNACSFLYAACARAGKILGYKTIQTYILASECGTSLLAAGWRMSGVSAGGDWNRPSRNGRRLDQPLEPKQRWEFSLNA